MSQECSTCGDRPSVCQCKPYFHRSKTQVSKPSTRLSELRAIFAQRASKGMQSWPVPEFRRGDLELLAEAIRRLQQFEDVFGSEVK